MSRWGTLGSAGDQTERNYNSTPLATNQRWIRRGESSGKPVAPSRVAGSSASRKSDNLNGTVPHRRREVRFEGSVRRLKVEIERYRNVIEDSRNGVRREGVDSPSHRLRNAVRCSIGELSQGLKDDSASSASASCISNDVKGVAIVLLFRCAELLSDRTFDKGINHGSETAPQQTVSFICEILRQTEGEIASIVMSDYDVSSCFKIILALWVLQIDLENVTCPTSRIKDEFIFADMLLLLQCLSSLLLHFGHQMKAETENITSLILLPSLDSALSVDKPNALQCWRMSMDCINCLVRIKRHASAVLAPLTIYITKSGGERYSANPLRVRTLRCLQTILIRSDLDEEHIMVSKTCLCLSNVLDAIKLVDKSSQTKITAPGGSRTPTTDFDVGGIARRIQYLIETHLMSFDVSAKETPCFLALGLLASLAQTYPRETASHWKLFLHSMGTKRRAPLMLSLIDSRIEPALVSKEIRAAAMKATKELLLAMPLRLWISGNPRPSARKNPGNLVIQVLSPLINIMEAITYTMHKFKQHDEVIIDVFESLCGMSRVIFDIVPFEAVDFTIVKPAIDLIREVGDLVADHTKNGIEGNVLSAAVAMIADCLGGRVTQQGQLTPLPVPAKEWLDDSASDDFIIQVFNFVSVNASMSYNYDSELLLDILNTISQLLRMAPWVLTKENIFLVKKFQQAVQETVNHNVVKVRCAGVKLIERYLHGRLDFIESVTKIEVELGLSLSIFLFDLLSDPDDSIRCVAVSAYSFFGASDWDMFLKERKRDHFHALLNLICAPREATAIRSEACKSIGVLCQTCFTMEKNIEDEVREEHCIKLPKSQARAVCQQVVDTMLKAIKDPKNASVRSMALFACGNLALALKEWRDTEPMIPSKSFIHLCTAIQCCLDDRNEKVVGNAIRTIGHLLYQSPFYHSLSEPKISYNDICEKLTEKIRFALEDVAEPSSTLSWTKRSNAKKHARGAASSLSFLLSVSVSESNYFFVQNALTVMIQCIKNAVILDEKITTSVVHTLKSTPMATWQHYRGEAVLGYWLATCLIAIFMEKEHGRSLPTQTAQDLNQVFIVVLSLTTEYDVCQVLANEDITPNMIGFLYSLMLDKEAESKTFEIIGLALQSSYLKNKHDVSMAQKFLSRAMHSQKRGISLGVKKRGSQHDPKGDETTDRDEDEL